MCQKRAEDKRDEALSKMRCDFRWILSLNLAHSQTTCCNSPEDRAKFEAAEGAARAEAEEQARAKKEKLERSKAHKAAKKG